MSFGLECTFKALGAPQHLSTQGKYAAPLAGNGEFAPPFGGGKPLLHQTELHQTELDTLCVPS